MSSQVRIRRNKVKEKWKAGQAYSWVLLDLMSPQLVEMLGLVGFDAVMLEGEHAALDEGQILELVRAAEIANITPVIRLRSVNYEQIGRLLDIGIQGIHATHIRSKAEAEHLVKCATYPPSGERGFGRYSRANRFGLADEAAAMRDGNEAVALTIAIEDIQGAENIEEICTVEGIDSIVIGPSDLAASLGVPGDYSNPRLQETIQRIRAAIAKSRFAGIPLFAREKGIPSAAANLFIATAFGELLEGKRDFMSIAYQGIDGTGTKPRQN